MPDEVRTFARLFDGRRDAYGADGGGCVREPVTLNLFRLHLEGIEPIGIYPLRDDLTVGWGCSDIDVNDEIMAWNLHGVLDALGLNPWVELSRSKGYHVWVFADEPCSARIMRDAFLAAHQIADVPAKEVNPKQVSLEGLMGYGNYVRLPYPARGESRRQVMIDRSGEPLPFDAWLEPAWEQRTPVVNIERTAELFAPPPPRESVVVGEYDGGLEPLVKRLNGLAFTIFRDGPLEGSDRSSTLAKLAHKCRESGLNPAEALAIVADLDRRVGKFHGRPDAEYRLMQIVEGAY